MAKVTIAENSRPSLKLIVERAGAALPLLFVLLMAFPSRSIAQMSRASESQVKAAYLYNFGKFVTWPADRVSDSFEICILGKDPFGHMLDATVTDGTINNKKITVRRISNVQQATSCSILFISTSEEGRLSTILAAVQHLNLLTVSDIQHFAERGGMIGLIEQQDRIRFEVNRAAAAKSHLLLSSELLKVAVTVIDNKGPGT